MKSYITALFFITMAVVQITAQTNGREIMELIKEQDRGTSTHALVSMDLIDKRGNISTRILELYSKENNEKKFNTMIVFHRPSSVKNTRFLSIGHNDKVPEQWIYMPALKRMKRITTSDADQSFLGTDFTYTDMGAMSIDSATYSLIREESLNGIQCWIVESIPMEYSGSDYSKTISWISKEMLLPVYIEMYDRQGKLVKKLTTENIEMIQGHWTPIVTKMENVQTGHST
ncbi:MAG: outer membrane lipoprotein-sorting protein, partial [Spirochaetales bacterium]|nr:outer membrane lipoprotein-sorting protein [Spirochaetales bacterium]